MSLKSLNQPLNRRSATRAALVILLISLTGAGAWFGWNAWQSRQHSATGNKETIRSFLREQTGQRHFAALVSDSMTNAEPASAADTADEFKKGKLKKKKQPPVTDYTRVFRLKLKEAADYKTVYRVLGEGLALADEMLSAKTTEDTETALFLAAEAARAAHDVAVNDWLAARIAEAYLWPGVEFANSPEARRVSSDYLLNLADDAFRGAGETNNLVKNHRLVIAQAGKAGKADKERYRLSRLLEEQSDFAGALAVMREMKDTNNGAFQRRVAAIEQQLKTRQLAN